MIDRQEDLLDLVEGLTEAEWISIDTEADSLHAYPEKLCLFQISVPQGDYLIDTLAGLDLRPLLQRLGPQELILHGADYDLRLLARTYRFVPSRIFDTMWAARLLGYPEFGLTHLVGQTLGVALEKGPQKMNWARRPLSERMETYARNDTRYLYPLAHQLKGRLEAAGRLSWLEEICANLIRECSVARVCDPEKVWRVKGSDRLNQHALAILRELWRWREEEAILANKPPYFIFRHESLVDLAESVARRGKIAGLIPTHLSPDRRARLAAALSRALLLDPSEYPSYLRPVGFRLTKAEQLRFTELRNRRDKKAAELGLDPTIVASRGMLMDLARDWDVHFSELFHWQRALLQANST